MVFRALSDKLSQMSRPSSPWNLYSRKLMFIGHHRQIEASCKTFHFLPLYYLILILLSRLPYWEQNELMAESRKGTVIKYLISLVTFLENRIHSFLLKTDLKGSGTYKHDPPTVTWEPKFRVCKVATPTSHSLTHLFSSVGSPYVPSILVVMTVCTLMSLQPITVLHKLTYTLESLGEL